MYGSNFATFLERIETMTINDIRIEPLPLQPFAHARPKGRSVYGCDNLFRSIKGDEWYACREEFHSRVGTGKSKCSGFFYGALNPLDLVGLIDWVERALNLHPKHRIQFFVCQNDTKAPPKIDPSGEGKYEGIVLIKMSKFWSSEKIRFYFLTALCRSHFKSKWLHPLDAILNVSYFHQTRRATALFLNGYTLLTGEYRNKDANWVNLFYNPTRTKNLDRPSSSADCKFFYDQDPRPQLLPEEKWRITKWVRETEQRDTALEPFSF
jgi:hypothetical protein